ncbi:hypothetical protein MHZ36_12835 [Staphylococcus sp. ACRSN]|uniref:hypothetical protein n=1 Tax=Staphylococcus sp. ACRSN TaxID=2918214 RepID=UPI001EF1F2BB|nr:hypothetical protein [Staphylococcus sp. ACRSN]MCG7340175.1 hypothetical protein [Staphylococcus sp. ACRSN]
MAKKRVASLEEFEPFIDKTIIITAMDGKKRKGTLIQVYQFSIMLETNINTKENPVKGYMLFMKHGIRSISQVAE